MTNVFNTLLLALCIADLLVIAANLPLAISVHTQLDMFRSPMPNAVNSLQSLKYQFKVARFSVSCL